MNIIKNLQGKNCLLNYVSLKDTNHLKNKPQRVTRTVFAQSCGSYKTQQVNQTSRKAE